MSFNCLVNKYLNYFLVIYDISVYKRNIIKIIVPVDS